MTLRDIAEVTWTITRLEITARAESTEYLHRWIIGEKPPYIKPGSRMYWAERAGKISVKKWIDEIVAECDKCRVPVFMKDSLIPIVGEENMRRELPWEVQT